MSTSPDIVQTLSHWLAGHVGLGEVERALDEPGELGAESAALVAELRDEIGSPDCSPARLQPLVRETIEAIALGE